MFACTAGSGVGSVEVERLVAHVVLIMVVARVGSGGCVEV